MLYTVPFVVYIWFTLLDIDVPHSHFVLWWGLFIFVNYSFNQFWLVVSGVAIQVSIIEYKEIEMKNGHYCHYL